MGRETGGRFKREGMCVYLWLIHVEVWQKTAKFCKAIILQLKKLIKKVIVILYIPISNTKNSFSSRNPGLAGYVFWYSQNGRYCTSMCWNSNCPFCNVHSFNAASFYGVSFFEINLFFNWRIIALQIFLVFCQTSAWISHRYAYIPSLFEPPSHLPPHPTPLGWYRAPVWVSWAIQQIPISYLFYTW